MTGFSSTADGQDFADPIVHDNYGPGNPLSPPVDGPPDAPAERDRTFYSPIDGVVTTSRWENPDDHDQGYGYEVRIRGKDGIEYRFAHVEPDSLVVGLNERIGKAQPVGHYADPPNGRATGPNLHVEKRLPNGEAADPKDDLPTIMPNFEMHSIFGPRTDPVTGQPGKMHNGADIVGPPVSP